MFVNADRLASPEAGCVALRSLRRATAGLVLTMLSIAGTSCPPSSSPQAAAVVALRPILHSEAVPRDADDPAIWVAPGADVGRSLILATDKAERRGGLHVFGLNGRLRQVITPLDRPNNVDVEYGLTVGGRHVDIAVLTERKQHRLRVFAIPADGGALRDIAPGGIPVFQDQAGDASEPMGIALYKRPKDGAIFAIVSRKSGGATEYLWQYRLEPAANGSVQGTLVRRFGNFSRSGEIEAVAVDDALGFVYYSDERFAIRKWHADPDHPKADQELAVFAKEGYQGDREGLAVYANPDGTGYLVSSDQVDGGSRLLLYRREGAPGDPHNHRETVASIPTTADATDGLEVVTQPLPGFPRGLLVMMNSGPRNFLFYSWQDVEATRRAAQ
jgi:3-phytase